LGDVVARQRLRLNVRHPQSIGPASRHARVVVVCVQRWIIHGDDVNDLERGLEVLGQSCRQLDSPAGPIGSISAYDDVHGGPPTPTHDDEPTRDLTVGATETAVAPIVVSFV
jgi:hypothetical protein